MMLGSSTTNVEICSTTLGAVNGKFNINIELMKVHKPNYATLLRKYDHIKGVKMIHIDTRN